MDQWIQEFKRYLLLALSEFQADGKKMVFFSVDCHPWHGTLALGFLSQEAADEKEFLMSVDEMAAWSHYNFGSSFPSAKEAARIGDQMQKRYEQGKDEDELGSIASEYFRACAEVLGDEDVIVALRRAAANEALVVSVADPDTGEEYYNK